MFIHTCILPVHGVIFVDQSAVMQIADWFDLIPACHIHTASLERTSWLCINKAYMSSIQPSEHKFVVKG